MLVGPLLAGALFAWVLVNTRWFGAAPYFVSSALCVIVCFWALTQRKKITPPVTPVSADNAFPVSLQSDQPPSV